MATFSLRFPVRIRIRTPPMPKNQPGFWLKRADSCSGTRPILYAPRQCKGRCIQARWRALSGEKPNDVVARWEWNSSGTCSPSAEFYFHLYVMGPATAATYPTAIYPPGVSVASYVLDAAQPRCFLRASGFSDLPCVAVKIKFV